MALAAALLCLLLYAGLPIAHIALVSLPFVGHVEPLVALAQSLSARDIRTTFAVPPGGPDIPRIPHLTEKTAGPAPFSNRSEELKAGALARATESSSYTRFGRRVAFFARYQDPIFHALVDTLAKDKPDLLVVDRFAFGGVDAAHHLGLPYVINNPHMMLDVDAPSPAVPVPFSGHLHTDLSTLDRCIAPWLRLRMRLAVGQAMQRVNEVRRTNGLGPLSSQWLRRDRALVLTNTAFGLEVSRELMPLFRMTGPMLPEPVAPRSVRAADTRGTPPAVRRVLDAIAAAQRRITAAASAASAAAAADAVPLAGRLALVDLQTDTAGVLARHAGTVVQALARAGLDVVVVAPRRTLRTMRHADWANATGLHILSCDPAWLLREGQLSAEGVPDAEPGLTANAFAVYLSDGTLSRVQRALSHGLPVLAAPSFVEHTEVAHRLRVLGTGAELQEEHLVQPDSLHAVLRVLLASPIVWRQLHFVRGVLHYTGGAKEAAHTLEAVIQTGTSDLAPASLSMPWYEAIAMDVLFTYGVIICAVALVARALWGTCGATMGVLLGPEERIKYD